MKTGITSVTFRELDCNEIVLLARQCHLDGIEWGGDVHAPVGSVNIERAKGIYSLTHDNGLEVLSYGSYYQLGEGQDFDEVLCIALALNAPVIRVWAGIKGSNEADEGYIKKVVDDANRICEIASRHGITICTEYHRGTLTDTAESTLSLLNMCDMLRTYWQPNPDISLADRLAEIDLLLPFITNIHVFSWGDGNVRYPLDEGVTEWRQYIQRLGGSRSYIMEFVKDDSPAQCIADANTLRGWVDFT